MTKGKKHKKVVYLRVVDELRKGSASRAAGVLDFSKQQISPLIKTLKILGIVERIGYGVWRVHDHHLGRLDSFLAEKSPKQVSNLESLWSQKKGGLSDKKLFTSFHSSERVKSSLGPDTVRTHALQFVLKVKGIRNWERRKEYLDSKGFDYVNIKQGQRFFVEGCRVWLTNKSIVIWLPNSFFVSNADTGYNYGVYEFLRIVSKLESLLNATFRLGGQYRFRVARQHHALIKNTLAKQYNKEKKKLFVFDEKGLWLVVDDSEGLGELETIHNRPDARSDNRKVQDFFNGIKDTGLTPEMVLQMIARVTDNQQVHAQNMLSHVDAIKELGAGVKELTGVVKKMDGELEARIDRAIAESKSKLGEDDVPKKPKEDHWLNFTWDPILK